MNVVNKSELLNVINKFIDKNENDQPNSIIVIENKTIDPQTNESKELSVYSVIEPISKIKILNNSILLDINFSNNLSPNMAAVMDSMDLYSELCKQSQYSIFNVISLVLNDDMASEQLKFVNPKFFNKSSNKAGRPINGIRLIYDFDSVMYIPQIPDDFFENIEQEEG